MAVIKINGFAGVFPKVGDRLLPDNAATKARNIKLTSGEIRPIRQPVLATKPNKPQPATSIYRAINQALQQAWLTWTTDVDVVRAPLSEDVESRLCWTGEGAPKYATYSQATEGGANNYPVAAFELGIPAPQTKPSVAHSGGTGIASTRFYVYTYFSELGEESAPSPVSDIVTGKVDGVWAITGMDLFPANGGTVAGTFSAGVTTFDAGSLFHWLRVGDEIVLGASTVKVLAVTSKSIFKVEGDFSAHISWARKTQWNTANMKRRLYRTAGTQAAFQLVADDVDVTYNDSLSDSAILGDDLITQGWELPPVGLLGLSLHPSGSLVGFFDNQLCFSEPYQPHAWPKAYRKQAGFQIVGIGVFGTEVGVGTKGTPYIASGVGPESMTMERRDGMYPCVSKRSLISIGNAVVYATRHGLASLSVSGVDIITGQFFTSDEWAAYSPATMVCAAAYGRVYVLSQTAGVKSIMSLETDMMINYDISATEIYADEATGELFIADADGIKLWDAPDGYPMNTDWQSKEFVFPAPVNLGAAKIEFDSVVSQVDVDAIQAQIDAIRASNAALIAEGRLFGAINDAGINTLPINGSKIRKPTTVPESNQITFILRSDSELIISRTVISTHAFRLPAGLKKDNYTIEVLGQCNIKEIRVAETMEGLKVT